MDQSLLCDEVWPSSPLATVKNYMIDFQTLSMYARSKQDYDESFTICLEKEMSYMPQPNYVENLCSNHLAIARIKSIQWFIKSISRLNLSLGTVFYAANYLDRFISMTPCNAWKHWMVELLSIACLSIASKFNETCSPTLLEIQMEDLDYSFDSSTIQQMEMMVLEALGWRLASTTAYSYLELMLSLIDIDFGSFKPQIHEQLIARFNSLLLGSISDSKLLEFRPSVVAISALGCSLDKSLVSSTASDTYRACATSLLDNNQKAELVRCQKFMEAKSVADDCLLVHGVFHFCPSSPTTVLLKERINYYHVDFSLFKMRAQKVNTADSTRICQKRKRVEEEKH
ncbi:putative cyclin-D7-1 [Argentina anserina]|uniref:putative cyclin-D7-1 n=1 Tax=Argentina anserina TaxID=57926 RepID=UPI0021764B7A|nr:putative cyclin-D7-1 [Potentilla anserina]